MLAWAVVAPVDATDPVPSVPPTTADASADSPQLGDAAPIDASHDDDVRPADATTVNTGASAAAPASVSRDREASHRANAEIDGPTRKEFEALSRRVESTERDNAQLREQLKRAGEAAQTPRPAARALAGRIGGYADVGFFWAGGDGSGIRPDTGSVHFPEYEGIVPDTWVFMGDPLSTAINTRGEPADTQESRAVVFDPVNNAGKSSFIANAFNLAVFASAGENFTFEGLIDFVPRGRDVSQAEGLFVGDFVDVKLVYVKYTVPAKRVRLSLYAGKFDPVFGYEYRAQESPDRMTITPSLLCRYTCGRPVGIKARLEMLQDRALVFNFSTTNGSNFSERFAFYNEVDTNDFKTLSGRLSYRIPVGAGLDIGSSGSFGAQDLQPSDNTYQWQYGFDLHLDIAGVDLTGEFLQGRVAGQSEAGEPRCGLAPCLRFLATYGQVGYRALNWLMPYIRVDWRDALHQSGASFVYISDLVRITPGVRFDINAYLVAKLEYTVNRELGRIPQFANDVFTSSLVAKF